MRDGGTAVRAPEHVRSVLLALAALFTHKRQGRGRNSTEQQNSRNHGALIERESKPSLPIPQAVHHHTSLGHQAPVSEKQLLDLSTEQAAPLSGPANAPAKTLQAIDVTAEVKPMVQPGPLEI